MSRQPPRLKDPLTEKAIRDVLDRLMKLEEKLGSQIGQPKQTEGAPGTVRAVKAADGTIKIQVRTEDGWHESADLTFQTKE